MAIWQISSVSNTGAIVSEPNLQSAVNAEPQGLICGNQLSCDHKQKACAGWIMDSGLNGECSYMGQRKNGSSEEYQGQRTS